MPQRGVNRDVHWDKTYKTNLGIDVRMLDNRFGITLDAYYDMGRELFTTFTGTSFYPTTVGTQATPENFGEVDTYGVELTLNWKDKIGKDFSYWVKLTTGYSDNKIKEAGFQATPGLMTLFVVNVLTVVYGGMNVLVCSAAIRKLRNILLRIILLHI